MFGTENTVQQILINRVGHFLLETNIITYI